MIIKRTVGVSASRALAYDYGPGRAQAHHRPHRVAGTCPQRDWRARGRAMDEQIRQAGDDQPGQKGRVIRLAVACAPEDRVLSDKEWARIAARTVDEYTGRVDNHTWEAVRHDPRHVHITVLQRGNDGKLAGLWRDRSRNLNICKNLEREHNLRSLDAERDQARDRARSRQAAAQRRTRQLDALGAQRERGSLAEQRQHAKQTRGAAQRPKPQAREAPQQAGLDIAGGRGAEVEPTERELAAGPREGQAVERAGDERGARRESRLPEWVLRKPPVERERLAAAWRQIQAKNAVKQQERDRGGHEMER